LNIDSTPELPLAAQTIYRYERKFVSPVGADAETALQLRLHPMLTREVHVPRIVNNLYLDLPDMSCFSTNVEGDAQRFKVRLRWYGERFFAGGSPALEIKRSHGHVRSKAVYPLSNETVGCLSRWLNDDRLVPMPDTIPIPELAQWLPEMRPVLFNRYHRRYFETVDGLLRITADGEQLYWRADSRNRLVDLYAISAPNGVVEIKHAPEVDALAAVFSRQLPYRISRNSKYAVGVALLHGLIY
jgi:hypothetical protein